VCVEREDTHSESSSGDAMSPSFHGAVDRSASRTTSEGMKKGDTERIVRASSCAIASGVRMVNTNVLIV
jgi:hypothetical protein